MIRFHIRAPESAAAKNPKPLPTPLALPVRGGEDSYQTVGSPSKSRFSPPLMSVDPLAGLMFLSLVGFGLFASSWVVMVSLMRLHGMLVLVSGRCKKYCDNYSQLKRLEAVYQAIPTSGPSLPVIHQRLRQNVDSLIHYHEELSDTIKRILGLQARLRKNFLFRMGEWIKLSSIKGIHGLFVILRHHREVIAHNLEKLRGTQLALLRDPLKVEIDLTLLPFPEHPSLTENEGTS